MHGCRAWTPFLCIVLVSLLAGCRHTVHSDKSRVDDATAPVAARRDNRGVPDRQTSGDATAPASQRNQGNDAEQTPDRRSVGDAIALFTQISDGYALNGQRMQGGPWDTATLAQLGESADTHVRKAAQLATTVSLLRNLNQQANAQFQQEVASQVERLPLIMAGSMADAFSRPDDTEDDLHSAAKMVEDITGSDTRGAANKVLSTRYVGTRVENAVKAEIGEWATTGERSRSDGGKTVTIMMNTIGGVTITNAGGQALHHCLIITRLLPDVQLIQRNASLESGFNALLPLAGFSDETAGSAQTSVRLRYDYDAQEKGVAVYVPEIPAGGAVAASFGTPFSYALTTVAGASLWSDELAVENRVADNFAEMKLAAQAYRPVTRPVYGGGQAGFVGGNGFPRSGQTGFGGGGFPNSGQGGFGGGGFPNGGQGGFGGFSRHSQSGSNRGFPGRNQNGFGGGNVHGGFGPNSFPRGGQGGFGGGAQPNGGLGGVGSGSFPRGGFGGTGSGSGFLRRGTGGYNMGSVPRGGLGGYGKWR